MTWPVVAWILLFCSVYSARWSSHELEMGGAIVQSFAEFALRVLVPASVGLLVVATCIQFAAFLVGMYRMLLLERERTYLNLFFWFFGAVLVGSAIMVVRVLL